MRSLRSTSINLNIYILSCPFHNKEQSPVDEELIKSGTFFKYMLKSSALMFLGMDLTLILGIMLLNSVQNERGFVRDELLTSVKYSLFLFFIISVIAFLNFLYSFIRESSFLFTAKSWILSLLYISFTISLVIQWFDLTYNREIFMGACLSETHKKMSYPGAQTSKMATPVSLQRANDALAPQNGYQQAQYCLQVFMHRNGFEPPAMTRWRLSKSSTSSRKFSQYFEFS